MDHHTPFFDVRSKVSLAVQNIFKGLQNKVQLFCECLCETLPFLFRSRQRTPAHD